MNDLLERMEDAWLDLSRRSFDSGDAGIAANVCQEAMDEIRALRNQLVSVQKPYDMRALAKFLYEHCGLGPDCAGEIAAELLGAYHIAALSDDLRDSGAPTASREPVQTDATQPAGSQTSAYRKGEE